MDIQHNNHLLYCNKHTTIIFAEWIVIEECVDPMFDVKMCTVARVHYTRVWYSLYRVTGVSLLVAVAHVHAY